MSNQYFVPVSDDIIYNHPERIEGPLVPYIAGMECHEWLSIEINPDESECESSALGLTKVNKAKPAKRSNLHLAYSAT